MLLHILKKDLKRKKTMNVVLILFVILASMFVASGLANVATVMNGTDYYLDKAGLGDYLIFQIGEDPRQTAEEFLDSNEWVKSYRVENVVTISQENLTCENREVKTKAMSILTSIEDKGLTYFDEDDNAIREIAPGHTYVTASFFIDMKLKKGDVLHISHGNTEMDLVVDGPMKDASLGSPMMGNIRFLLSGEDMEKFYTDDAIHSLYRGKCIYVDTDNVKEFTASLAGLSNISFDGARSLIKMTYVLTMIIVFVVLIMSVVLIIVAFLVLRFAINISVNEDFREIGVMKAIGIRNRRIRSLYVAKYLTLAIVGTLIGLLLSFPFGKLLMKSVTDNMMLGNDSDLLLHVIGALAVVLVISGFAWFCTRKVKKLSPVDAIRNGQTGERFRKKRVRKTRGGKRTALFLATNDLRCKPKRYISVFLSLFICTLLVLSIVNTTSTMRSDSFIHTFGAKGDIYVSGTAAEKTARTEGLDGLKAYLEEKRSELEEAGYPCQIIQDIQYKYTTDVEGKIYKCSFQQGVNASMDDYIMQSGTAPQNGYEVAVTKAVTDKTGLKIGDTFKVYMGEEEVEFLVTGTYQTMNNLGDMILLHPDAPTDSNYLSNMMGVCIRFADSPEDKEIKNRKKIVSEVFEADLEKVSTAEEFCVETMGAADTMEALQNLLLVITMIVVILITILVERSFVADEKSQIALLKAVGFRDSKVIRWHVLRFSIVSLLAIVLAVALSVPVTHLAITPIFAMMGAGKVDYRYSLSLTALYPAIIFAFTVLMTRVVARCTKKIKSRDTASIE